MSIKPITLIIILASLSSCVSSKIFNELDSKYNQLKSDYDNLSLLNEDLIVNKNGLATELFNLQKTCDDINSNKNEMSSELVILKKKIS